MRGKLGHRFRVIDHRGLAPDVDADCSLSELDFNHLAFHAMRLSVIIKFVILFYILIQLMKLPAIQLAYKIQRKF